MESYVYFKFSFHVFFVRCSSLYELELNRLVNVVRRLGASRILIQFPEGLKPYASKIVSAANSVNAIPIVLADPCYGGCDVAFMEAKALNIDLIVHYGHTEMVNGEIPVVYFEARMNLPILNAVRKAVPLLSDYKRIGLASTVQHIHKLSSIKDFLEKEGFQVFIGESSGFGVKYKGQILGCNYSPLRSIKDNIDAILLVGSRFHGVGARIAVYKPTIVADPYTNSAYNVDELAFKLLKIRYANILEAKESKRFGVILGLKPGQMRMHLALKALNMLKSAGREAYIIAAREINPEVLAGFDVDAYVNTACPRISLDDAKRFKKPIITFKELLVVLNEISWEELLTGGWF